MKGLSVFTSNYFQFPSLTSSSWFLFLSFLTFMSFSIPVRTFESVHGKVMRFPFLCLLVLSHFNFFLVQRTNFRHYLLSVISLFCFHYFSISCLVFSPFFCLDFALCNSRQDLSTCTASLGMASCTVTAPGTVFAFLSSDIVFYPFSLSDS